MYSQPMTADANALVRLGNYVEQRVAELGLEYAAVCRAGGFSDETLSKIRKGTIQARPATYRKLERALRWGQGSVASILAGGEPALLATDGGQQPEEVETPQASTDLRLSPSEALRRVVRSSARDLGVTADGFEEAMRLARQDLAIERTDLSDLVREARLAAKLSLAEVAARAVDPESGDHVVDADWLARLEAASLDPTETPEYAQLDALTEVLNLDPSEVQERAGAQFMGVHTIWSDDGQVRGISGTELTEPEDVAKAQELIRLYRKAPKLDG